MATFPQDFPQANIHYSKVGLRYDYIYIFIFNLVSLLTFNLILILIYNLYFILLHQTGVFQIPQSPLYTSLSATLHIRKNAAKFLLLLNIFSVSYKEKQHPPYRLRSNLHIRCCNFQLSIAYRQFQSSTVLLYHSFSKKSSHFFPIFTFADRPKV